jgi:hypothetical protein
MASSAAVGLSRLLMTCVFLRFLLLYTHDEKEPTAVATQIPFVSAMIGMAKKAKFSTHFQ